MKTTDTASEYDKQAADFINKHGLKIRITLSDTKSPAWSGNHSGHHYRVTISRDRYAGYNSHSPKARIVFDFWGSVNDAEKGVDPSAYDVLACISGDIYTPETFEDFCAEYGEGEDSIKALQTFRRCSRFAKRLRAFFSEEEQEALSEIR